MEHKILVWLIIDEVLDLMKYIKWLAWTRADTATKFSDVPLGGLRGAISEGTTTGQQSPCLATANDLPFFSQYFKAKEQLKILVAEYASI